MFNQEFQEQLKTVTINGFISWKIQWLGYVLRHSADTIIRLVMVRKPQGKRPVAFEKGGLILWKNIRKTWECEIERK